MLQRYLDKPVLYVPMTANRYSFKDMTFFYDHVKEQILPSIYIDGEYFVEIDFGFGSYRLKRAVAIALTAKRTQLPLRYWSQLDVYYADLNKENTHPKNLIWKYPEKGIELGNGFYYIPGFSRYCINKAGDVFSVPFGKIISKYTDAMGYWMYGVTPDVGNRTILGMHRLLVLTFLPYPHAVDRLDVNHKDGDKSNNVLSNLEWSSRKGNCNHAYSTGLRTDNISVDVRNIFTGQVNTFYSIEECARKTSTDGETVRLRLKTDGQKVYSPGFQFKKSSSSTPWMEIRDPVNSILTSKQPLPLMSRNTDTGEVKKHRTVSDFFSTMGLSDGSYYLGDKIGVKKVLNYEVWLLDFKELSLSILSEKTE